MAIRMLFALPFFVMSAKNTPADDVLAKPEYDWLNKPVIYFHGNAQGKQRGHPFLQGIVVQLSLETTLEGGDGDVMDHAVYAYPHERNHKSAKSPLTPSSHSAVIRSPIPLNSECSEIYLRINPLVSTTASAIRLKASARSG